MKLVYVIGDVYSNIKLAHAASTQVICAVETIPQNKHAAYHNANAVPAAHFTHANITAVGLTEPKAKEVLDLFN